MSLTTVRLMLRMLRRDWRAGELSVLGVALVLAVAALTSVGFLADRVEQALQRESHQLLGGDLLLTADHPWAAEIAQEAARRGLQVAQSVSFPSMVGVAEGEQANVVLADIKAVSDNFPLRGSLRAAPAVNSPDAAIKRTPTPGEVWPDERLAAALALRAGMPVTLGVLTPKVGMVLTREPDRGMNVMALAPRLMINLADLPKTGLIQLGSRINYRLHIAGEAASVADFATWMKERMGRGEKVEGLENARPEVRNVLDRAQRFLRLAALLSVVMAAIAVAMSAERYLRRHLDACAVMRCMGAQESQILAIHGGEFVLFGLIAIVFGGALGYLVQFALLAILGAFLFPDLPAPSLLPWRHGLLVGLALLAGFAFPPLLRLRRVSTVRVLRREFDGELGGSVLAYAGGALVLTGLLLWMADDLKLGALVLGGFATAIALYAGAGYGLLRLLQVWRPSGAGYGWRHGVVNLLRHPRATVVQLVALGLGLTALLLLSVARGDLLTSWQKKSPPDAPNRFVINIQPPQVPAVRTFFENEGLSSVRLEPMVRARLMAINGRAVVPTDFVDERARRLVDREFNLSWASELPPGNEVTAGRWHTAESVAPKGEAELSVEQGLAETLGFKLGDQLDYQIGGMAMRGVITSLRKLEWDSMRVNFFVIASPGVLENYSASYITSVHLAPAQASLVTRLLQQFPNLTVIDMVSLITQVRETIDQVVGAVQLIFGFSLLAGVAVLLASLQAGLDERRQELAVLRALGARSRQLVQALLAEYAVLGAMAGLLGGFGASAIGWVLARFAFELDYWPDPAIALTGIAIGLLVVCLAGGLGMRPVLNQPALTSLRGG
ncbi:MAG: FtsX-like permease family protein [Rhodocyclaceae bacterium]|nr:FtsX-like permease family protein [Rhodocyclaceae bacterium]